MYNRIAPRIRTRPLSGLHLRLARSRDILGLAAFCLRHQEAAVSRRRSPGELAALLQGHVETVIVALQHDVLLGVAMCGVSQNRARLLELIVRPGPQQSQLERRLLRRSLRNLRTLGVNSLEFQTPATPVRVAAPAGQFIKPA